MESERATTAKVVVATTVALSFIGKERPVRVLRTKERL